ncbi:hypothetical protein [Variovorax sp. KK3]|uniref:hypothetical protein n=1 Tax=Variovorax sp. KK3 TaxID=1855728 RepID=UPI00097C76A3|nr:hypothetical protein [Variovorax sp. KK3]
MPLLGNLIANGVPASQAERSALVMECMRHGASVDLEQILRKIKITTLTLCGPLDAFALRVLLDALPSSRPIKTLELQFLGVNEGGEAETLLDVICEMRPEQLVLNWVGMAPGRLARTFPGRQPPLQSLHVKGRCAPDLLAAVIERTRPNRLTFERLRIDLEAHATISDALRTYEGPHALAFRNCRFEWKHSPLQAPGVARLCITQCSLDNESWLNTLRTLSNRCEVEYLHIDLKHLADSKLVSALMSCELVYLFNRPESKLSHVEVLGFGSPYWNILVEGVRSNANLRRLSIPSAPPSEETAEAIRTNRRKHYQQVIVRAAAQAVFGANDPRVVSPQLVDPALAAHLGDFASSGPEDATTLALVNTAAFSNANRAIRHHLRQHPEPRVEDYFDAV